MSTHANAPGGDQIAGGAEDEQVGCVAAPMVRRDRRAWRSVWEPMRQQVRAEMEARRARVLAHPDLAKALTVEPVGYARPEQWTGYVPPRTDPPRLGRGGAAPLNTSPRRRALVELAAEALRREQQEVTS